MQAPVLMNTSILCPLCQKDCNEQVIFILFSMFFSFIYEFKLIYLTQIKSKLESHLKESHSVINQDAFKVLISSAKTING